MLVFRSRSILVACVPLMLVACGGRAAPSPVPADPGTTVRDFLKAVEVKDLRTMGRLWGGARGPAAGYMPADQLEKRLTVIQIYLEHEGYEILPDNQQTSVADQLTVRVRLRRRGCKPVVPFTLMRYRSGWIVSNIDLAAAGNPDRPCEPPQQKTIR